MPAFLLSCLTYLGVALPGSTLGLLWPSMRMSSHAPVGAWNMPPTASAAAEPAGRASHRPVLLPRVLFTAVETGVEATAGIWGYVFLTSGRGLSPVAAGTAVSAYWAMMFAGRILLGPVAQRAGAARVLTLAVAGVPCGALLMALPLPGGFAVAGMMALGLAAAPVFPLITLASGGRSGGAGPDGGAAAAVGLQAAASAVGGAALPAGVGLAVGAFGGWTLGPSLLTLGVAMWAVYWAALR